jgi:hypothetical protein
MQLLKALDIDALVDAHVHPKMQNTKRLHDSLRGNIQVSFGIAGGQNVGAPLDPAAIKRQYGATQPRILNYTTEDRNVASALEIGWKIGKVAKVPFCQEGFLLQNPQDEGIFDFIQETLGHRERWASMTPRTMEEVPSDPSPAHFKLMKTFTSNNTTGKISRSSLSNQG